MLKTGTEVCNQMMRYATFADAERSVNLANEMSSSPTSDDTKPIDVVPAVSLAHIEKGNVSMRADDEVLYASPA
jgi:hypothetical protein